MVELKAPRAVDYVLTMSYEPPFAAGNKMLWHGVHATVHALTLTSSSANSLRKRKVTPVGFEPTQLALVELESTPLDHSGKVSVAEVHAADVSALFIHLHVQR